MKKLKIKVFSTIFSILSLFTIFVLVINNYRNYDMQKKSVENILDKLPLSLRDKKDTSPRFPKPDNEPNNKNNKYFLDFTVYTIILNENGKYKELINHSEDEIKETKIKKIANNIIKNHKDKRYIGNLYFNKYSYFFNNNNTLTIVDNTNIQDKLIKNLYTTIILFFLLGTIIFILSHILTKWIIKPVITSFNKQKEFIEDASHELKTPLSIILASTDAYYLKKEDKWVNNIKDEANKMTKLVIEMLDLAKTEKNNKDTYINENISKILEKNILTFESMFFEKNINLKYEIKDNIYLLCNKEQIERLINILLDNAINHSDKNGQIKISLQSSSKEIIMMVSNKGLPIKKGEEKNIFERFYRSDESRNRNNNRYGLGLAIAKNIVESHNGKIEAYSTNGYTTFKIIWNQK